MLDQLGFLRADMSRVEGKIDRVDSRVAAVESTVQRALYTGEGDRFGLVAEFAVMRQQLNDLRGETERRSSRNGAAYGSIAGAFVAGAIAYLGRALRIF